MIYYYYYCNLNQALGIERSVRVLSEFLPRICYRMLKLLACLLLASRTVPSVACPDRWHGCARLVKLDGRVAPGWLSAGTS